MRIDDLHSEEPGAGATRSRWPAILGTGAVVAMLGAGAWYWLGREAPPPQPPIHSEQPEAPKPPPPARAPWLYGIELPPLDASDPLVRRLGTALSEDARLQRWLGADRLVRRFVASVDNLAEGVSPRANLSFLAPRGSFRARRRGDWTTFDPASYRRYDALVDVFVSLDTQRVAELYRAFEPLLDQAYQDLGYPGRRFRDTLTRAIRRLLATPVVDDEVALVRGVTSYSFADSRLESLSAAQKHLLRTGPRNVRRIEDKLRAIALAIGIPAGDLPPAAP